MILDTVGSTFAKLSTKGLAAPAVLTRTTHGAHNSATGAPAAGTTTNCACLAVLDSSSLKTLGFVFDSNLVQGGDIQALIPAKGLTFDPLPGDTLTIGAVVYIVVDVKPTYAGSVPVMFGLLVRK